MKSAASLFFIWGSLGSGTVVAQQPGRSVPRLVPVFVTTRIDDAPVSFLKPLIVNGYGETLYSSNEANDTKLIVVDSLGKVLVRFGVPGEGPGEVREPRPIGVGGDAFITWDPALGRMVRWSRAGKPVASTRLETAASIGTLAPGGYLARSRSSSDGSWQPVLIRDDGSSRDLLAGTGSELPRAPSPTSHSIEVSPVLGTWPGGFLIAEPNGYTISLYDWDGGITATFSRPSAPIIPTNGRLDAFLKAIPGARSRSAEQIAAIREQVASLYLPQIAPGVAPGTDGRGRTWLMGFAGDSAFADIFNGKTFVTRLAVPCHIFQGSFSVAGHWLATACLPDDPDFLGDAVLKLFRIVD